MPELVHAYEPRNIFYPFHRRTQRWSILVAHRRAGKTVAVVNDTISRALYFDRSNDGQFAYVAPFYGQAKKIAWSYFKQFTRGMTSRISESELSLKFKHNSATISLFGADNPDSFRGLYFDGVDLDEYGNMRPSVWGEVLLPTLIDRQGWATFIGTPNGPNHFRDLYRSALKDPARWYVDHLPVSQTKLIPDEELEEMKKLMLEEEYLQEMECSFEASTRGAFYAKELLVAESEGRIRSVLPDQSSPLNFIYDLGYTDDTATIAFQEQADGYPILHAESDNLRPIKHYLERIAAICSYYGCPRGQIWLPHDAKAKSLQTGRSIVEQFLNHGIRPRIVPSLDVLDGIQAARLLFPEIYFNELPTSDLVQALKTYRREWDEDKKAFKNKPVEDWSVHYADVFRYFALVTRKLKGIPESPVEERENKVLQLGNHYAFTLEQLHEDRLGKTTIFL